MLAALTLTLPHVTLPHVTLQQPAFQILQFRTDPCRVVPGTTLASQTPLHKVGTTVKIQKASLILMSAVAVPERTRH